MCRSISSDKPVRELLPVRHVGAAGVGRDREARRDGHAELRHLGEADALAAEQLAAALGRLVEAVDVTPVSSHCEKSSHSGFSVSSSGEAPVPRGPRSVPGERAGRRGRHDRAEPDRLRARPRWAQRRPDEHLHHSTRRQRLAARDGAADAPGPRRRLRAGLGARRPEPRLRAEPALLGRRPDAPDGGLGARRRRPAADDRPVRRDAVVLAGRPADRVHARGAVRRRADGLALHRGRRRPAPEPLLADGIDLSAAWSPDGRTIAFSRLESTSRPLARGDALPGRRGRLARAQPRNRTGARRLGRPGRPTARGSRSSPSTTPTLPPAPPPHARRAASST